jgi:malonyl-CoA O-methyltransferase
MLSRRSVEIAASFGAHAKSYERHAGLQRAVADRLARLLPERKQPNVLELGCGTGLFSRHLLARYPEGRFVLTDAAPAMIAECRRNLAAAVEHDIALASGPCREPRALTAAARPERRPNVRDARP